jgi:Domain of unknown function (DUF1992)
MEDDEANPATCIRFWGERHAFASTGGVTYFFLVRFKTMSFQKNVDERISEAIAKGEFDNLPGKGKPLDLDAYFATPEHLRMGYSILKSADIIPEEMELLRQIEGLRKSLDSSTTRIENKALRQQLSEKLTDFNMRMEQNRKRHLTRRCS